jgi:glycosyltransferase involved in cell wall biosynthesis
MIVNQLLPTLHEGDAIGDEVRQLQDFFSAAGCRSAIYVLQCDPGLESLIRPFSTFLPEYDERSLTLYHFGLPSVMTDVFASLPGVKGVLYHNITPAHFFAGFSDELVHLAEEGRRQLKSLARCTDLALADSAFNCAELDSMGFKKTGVLPLLMDHGRYETAPSPVLSKMLQADDAEVILFVGRIYPNKKIEDLIKAYYTYKTFLNPASRLIIAGRCGGIPAYYHALLNLTRALELSTEEVWFTDYIPFHDLLALYHQADLFLSMSEHEGFCVPLLESMTCGLPILAYDAGAVGETLGPGGILFSRKDVSQIAEMIDRMIHDRRLRGEIRQAQIKRLADFSFQAVTAQIRHHFEPWL